MLTTSRIAEIGALVGEPARAAMLVTLLDGRALTAGELAAAAGVTPQTASSHIARLADAGLLVVERQGRHRYHRLASPSTAQMLEGIMAVASTARPTARPMRTGPRDESLRFARTCYDHLAGRLAVAVTDRLVARRELELSADGGALTPQGDRFLRDMGVRLDTEATARSGRVFCRPCLDWSERRPHLAGRLGAALLETFLARAWLRRVDGSRAVQVTLAGRQALAAAFELESQLWR